MSKKDNIIKAYTEPMPDGESWYEERKAKCEMCKYNTKNLTSGDNTTYKSLVAQVLNKINPLKIEGEGNCTLCTCPTYRKCSVKEESCPDGRWKALAHSDKSIYIEALSGIEELILDAVDQYIVTVPDTKVGNIYDMEMYIKPKKYGSKLKRIATSCGCLMAEAVTETEGKSKIKLTLSTATKKVMDNQSVKLFLYFSNKNLVDSSTQITVKFNVKADEEN